MPNFKLEQIFIAMLETSERRGIIMRNDDLSLTGMEGPQCGFSTTVPQPGQKGPVETVFSGQNY